MIRDAVLLRMIRVVLLLLLLPVAHGLKAQATLELHVESTRPDAGGLIRLAICRGQVAYESLQGCMERSIPAKEDPVRVLVENIPPGTYAIKAFHDVNESGAMDTGLFGLPKEPYGFSNNVMGAFGPPDFSKASFEVGPGKNVHRMRMRD